MNRPLFVYLVIATFSIPWGTTTAQELDLQAADAIPLVDLNTVLDLVSAEEIAKEETASDAPNPLVVEGPKNERVTPAVAEQAAETLPPPQPVSDTPSAIEAEPVSERDATTTHVVRELEGEPLLRGPVHEAFAEPLQNTPTPDDVIRKAPPAPIEEIAPELTDGGKNMEWIEGYWAWDQQTKDYVWISGVWRKKPKDRVWVAGRWEKVEEGYQWVHGAWLPVADGEVVVEKQVLPAPPKSLEQGPTSPAPSEEHFWVPGTWQRNNQDYAWRPGYWSRSQQNWVWVPDHYIWDPAGCVFVPGYWDYTWERRGTLYAPCTFGAYDVAQQVCYRPTRVIDTDQWLLNLWMGPNSQSYYFGNYYDCRTLGYTPWYQYYGGNRGFYDPFYTYYRWRFPATYGVGLYGYLNQLYLYYGTRSTLWPSVRLSPYRQFGTRGYRSLYGDVYGLSRLANIDLNPRNRYGYGRDYFDDYFYRNRYGRGGYGRSSDALRDLQRNRNRNDRDRDRSRDIVDRDRSRSEADRNRRSVDTMGPIRRTPGGQTGRANRNGRPLADGSNLPTAGGRRPDGSRRPENGRRPDAVVGAERNRGRTGADDIAGNRGRTPEARPRGNSTVRSTNTPSTSATRQTTPRQTNPGFSISSMRNARDRAEVERQRAAMQEWARQRQRTSQPARTTPITRSPSVNRSPSATRSPSVNRSSPIARPPANRSPSITRSPSATRSTPPRQTNTFRSQSAVRTPSVTRSQPAPRPAVRAPSRPAVQPRTSASRPQSRPSNPGFSISGMKNARSRGDVQKQRAAMQNLIRQRKGR